MCREGQLLADCSRSRCRREEDRSRHRSPSKTDVAQVQGRWDRSLESGVLLTTLDPGEEERQSYETDSTRAVRLLANGHEQRERRRRPCCW